MKKLITLVFLLVSLDSTAQVRSWLRAVAFNSNVYSTRKNLRITKFSELDGDPVTEAAVTLQPALGRSVRYKIVSEEGDYTIIKLLPRLSETAGVITVRTGDLPAGSTNPTPFFYYIKTSDFTPNTKNVLSEKIVGTPLIFPFKLRLQDEGDGATILSELAVGYTFGLRIKLSRKPANQNFLTLVPYGFGIGKDKYFRKNADGTYSEKKDAVAITYWTPGLMLTSHKVNFGVFVGFDAMIDKQNDWAYQSDPWLSIGVGFKFKDD